MVAGDDTSNGPVAGAPPTRQPRMFANVRTDIWKACHANQHHYDALAVLRELFHPGTQAILVHRFGYWSDHLPPGLRHVLRVFHFFLQYVFAWRVGISIPVKARIGPGLVIHTWGGGVFLPNARIGRNLTIIGGGILMDYDVREIGDDVWIGAGAKCVGKIRIGDRVHLAPNTVVLSDVPSDSVVFGNPGRVMKAVPKPPPAGA